MPADGADIFEDGEIAAFNGKWIGNGLIKGSDENGDYYELEVD